MAQTQALTPDQVKRYSRHIIMPQVGSKGQRSLLDAKVLIVGAGGLGSPAAVYLTLAGVGTVGIVDFDTVDLSNLQRQILHQQSDVGRPKVESARETLHNYNSDVNVVLHEAPLTSENAMEIISQYDVIVNGADNFPARYLVNDASYLCGKPLVDGSILLFDGQASVFLPGQGCYRCLFPAPPASRRGAQLRRGRCAGSSAGHGGQHPGRGDNQADNRRRRASGGPPAHYRRPQHGFSLREAAAQQPVPPLRRQPHNTRAHRLCGLLRPAGARHRHPGIGILRSREGLDRQP